MLEYSLEQNEPKREPSPPGSPATLKSIERLEIKA